VESKATSSGPLLSVIFPITIFVLPSMTDTTPLPCTATYKLLLEESNAIPFGKMPTEIFVSTVLVEPLITEMAPGLKKDPLAATYKFPLDESKAMPWDP